ncbi:arrestin domain-containing protein 1-like [Dreissena polymorpha]|uniref:Arrestin C-terminal-like domain-containing protein n=1 Tax=Dreissena polymorpha TaxID=45954 RepID=A0A9D4ELG9_DREPO|nr:arrestin domain-containing protein 1-like [Dreissena polymorpha]KAH3781823.1 hypothetical protein DPMN_159730 [Dreissena polymorpha]
MDLTYELRDDEDDGDVLTSRKYVTEFEVELTNAHNKTYLLNQLVEGVVRLNLKRPLEIRGIVVWFCGRTDIYWTEKRRGSATKCFDTVQFDAHEDYFNIRNYILEPGYVNAGETRLPFKFQLTPPLPENFEDNLCRIEYFVEATLKLDYNPDNNFKTREDFLVFDPYDLNKTVLPDVSFPVHAQKSLAPKRFCCCGLLPPMVAFLRLTRSGYSPGETIHAQADVENNSPKRIQDVRFSLYEERVYKTKYKTHVVRDDIVSASGGSVGSGETRHWPNVPLTIPKQQLFNVTNSNIFTIRHRLEMLLVPQDLKVVVEIVLGAIPLSNRDIQAPPHSRMGPGRPTGETVADFEKRRKSATDTQTTTSQASLRQHENQTRQRRKDRNRRIYPDNIIDSRTYADHVKNMRHERLPPFDHIDG